VLVKQAEKFLGGVIGMSDGEDLICHVRPPSRQL
jgi:hypothetical protein